MNTQTPVARRMSAWLMSAATLLVATAITAWAPPAQAQVGKATTTAGAAICDFSGFTYDAATNSLTINCSTGTPPPPPPPPPECPAGSNTGTFSFWNPGTTVNANAAAVEVQVHRSNATDCQITLTWTAMQSGLSGAVLRDASGNALGNTGTIVFAAGDFAPRKFFVTPGTANGTMTLSLAGGPAGVVTPFASNVITVVNGTTGTPIPPPPPPPPGCQTSANHTASFDFNGQKHVFDLKPGETAAVSFRTRDISDVEVSTTETVNTPITADHQVAVSTCPGDFSKTSPCMYTANLTGQTMFTTTQPLAWWAAGSKCKLDPNLTYYMNIRQVKRDNTTVNSCTSFTCQIRVQVQNYF